MKMEWVFVNPTHAKGLLSYNTGNRRLRPSTVSHYADQMRRGEWKETHQPIAFDDDGNLIDGQHRLAAVVESGVGVYFWVCTYNGRAVATGLPIDLQARRTAADILQQDKRATEVAAVISRAGSNHSRAVTIDAVRDTLAVFGKHIAAVNEAVKQKGPRRAAASVRAAVVMRCAEAGTDEMAAALVNQYRAFVVLDFEECWPSVKSLIKQFDAQSVASTGSGATQEVFRLVRTWKAFDYASRNVGVIRVAADDASLKEMRRLVVAAVGDKAGRTAIDNGQQTE